MGRKDCFPGADGSTIGQNDVPNAETIAIYGADGSVLTEGSGPGLQFVNITTNGVLNGNNSQVYAIKNPLCFIYNTTTPYDWYTNSATYQNDALWDDGTDKSDFDPCPQGWRVAPNGTWDDFTRTDDILQPMKGSFPYYINGNANEQGNLKSQTNGRLYNAISSIQGILQVWYPATGNRNYSYGYLSVCGQSGYSRSQSHHVLDGGMTLVKPAATYALAFGFPVRCIQE